MATKEVEFLSPKKYRYEKKIGEGACGETVVLYDNDMDFRLVCKKFSPIISKSNKPEFHKELLSRFKEECKILFRLNHPNIVRVFGFHDYQGHDTGYMLMELIEGNSISEFLKKSPNSTAKVFEDVINGFAHLEDAGILHRDIRPANIMVNDNETAKIIDFGFGKIVDDPEINDDKSISLNLWCDPPTEYMEGTYNFQTEIYFVGKLFEQILKDLNLSSFPYVKIIRGMCKLDAKDRSLSFAKIYRTLQGSDIGSLEFSKDDKKIYRNFTSNLSEVVSDLSFDVKYERDYDKIITDLERLYANNLLEETLPSPSKLGIIFLNGGFKYMRKAEVYVDTIKTFSDWFGALSTEKRSVVLNNLYSRFDAIDRYHDSALDDEIPF